MAVRGKVSIVGAGGVGATIAYAALIRGVAKQVALYDVDGAKARAEALDLVHGSQFVRPATVVGSDDLAVTEDSEVVVVTAGAKQQPGQTRLELAGVNVRMCRTLVPGLVERSPDAVLLLVTNPVDVVTYAAERVSGLPSGRVLGSGTVLDSSRLRTLLAERCAVAVQSVHAYIAGEHGDSELPVWSQATIGGVPLRDWHGVDDHVLSEIAHEVVTAAEQIIRGKGATTYAVGLATTRILEALLHDERAVLPVSSLLNGQYGIDDVCLSLPSVVGRGGVEAVLTPPLSADEVGALRRSAETVRGVARSLGL